MGNLFLSSSFSFYRLNAFDTSSPPPTSISRSSAGRARAFLIFTSLIYSPLFKPLQKTVSYAYTLHFVLFIAPFYYVLFCGAPFKAGQRLRASLVRIFKQLLHRCRVNIDFRLAATLGPKSSFKKLPKQSIRTADISQLCDQISRPPEPLALRLSSNLMVGVARYVTEH